jgi:hypothetical protein
MQCLPPEKVVNNFTEVETGLLNDGAMAEGKRCFQCGFRNQIAPSPRPPDTCAKKTVDSEKIESKA